jgi:5-formyltetrahydrofolate cyclo-ligase
VEITVTTIYVDTAMATRQTLRRQMRWRRRRVARTERDACALRLAQVAVREPMVRNSRRIAVYLPVNGEMDPRPLMNYLCSLGKTLYLPMLAGFSRRRLGFSAYLPGDPLVRNRYGIAEPSRLHARRIKTAALDLVLMPLVAFDATGHRLGMGGGYYDYTFAYINRRTRWRKPRLMGLAYEFQRVPFIEPEPWDVNLDAVATERHVYHCSSIKPRRSRITDTCATTGRAPTA